MKPGRKRSAFQVAVVKRMTEALGKPGRCEFVKDKKSNDLYMFWFARVQWDGRLNRHVRVGYNENKRSEDLKLGVALDWLDEFCDGKVTYGCDVWSIPSVGGQPVPRLGFRILIKGEATT